MAALSLSASGCPSTSNATLRVDVRTDFVPEVEFSRVTVLLEGESLSDVYEARFEDDFVAGVRVATLDGVSLGAQTVRAQLVGSDGRSFVTRRVSTELRSSTTVTLVITRSCSGVSCPAGDDPLAIECVGGRCVSPECSPENPAACGEPACSVDGDCGPASVDCARNVCRAGECFVGSAPAACATAEYCDPDEGCLPRSGAPVDGGPIDPPDGGAPVTGPPENALSNVTAVAAGASHACARADLDVLCWGANGSGQLGDGTMAQRNAPASVVPDVGTELFAGRAFSCAMGPSLDCWGDNALGQLGQGGGPGSTTPLTVLDDNFKVGVGDAHGCAAERNLCTGPGGCNEDVLCWGANADGQLGDGTRTNRPSPVSLGISDDIYWVIAGARHTCYSALSGVYCWGANGSGQLGLGDTTARLTPTVLLGGAFTGVSILEAGRDHTCWFRDDQLACWGANDRGQLGDGTTTQRTSPTASTFDGSIAFLGLGAEHSCAVTEDDRLFCWGANDQGQLGVGDTDDRPSPTEVTLDPTDDTIVAAEVVAGDAFTCALTISEHVLCWGAGASGALGDGAATASASPVYVIDGRLPAP